MEKRLMTIKKRKQARAIEAERLYPELLQRGIVRKNEKEATMLLLESIIIAEERTRKVPSQKTAYKGIEFGFDSYLDMAIYFITEIPDEWEKWKLQTKVHQQTEDEIAKGLTRPTIDRIVDELGYIRGNLQTLSHEENNAKAKRKQMKPRALLVTDNGTLSFKVHESESATARVLGVSNGKVKNMGKGGYAVIDEATGADTGQVAITIPVITLEPTESEEEYKAQCEAYGITYETHEVREERVKKQVAKILEGNYFELR